MLLTKTFCGSTIVPLIIIALSGCNLTPKQTYSLQPGDEISIVSGAKQSSQTRGDFRVKKSNHETSLKGSSGGSSGGNLNFINFNSLPVVATVVAVVVAAVVVIKAAKVATEAVKIASEAAVEATNLVTGTEYVSIKSKALVTANLNEYFTQQNSQDAFVNADIASADDYDVKPTQAKKGISVHIERLGFESTMDGQLILKMNAVAVLYITNKTGKRIEIRTKNYKYTGVAQAFELWNNPQDDFYQSNLEQGFNALADLMLTTL
jgi:hypothetical protein